MGDLYEVSNAVLLSMADYEGVGAIYDLGFAAVTFAANESFQKGKGDGSKSYVSNLPAVLSSTVDLAIDVCSVCMDSFNLKNSSVVEEEDEEECSVKQVPCGHLYHADCITTWLSRHNTCPLCRCKILTD